jgi:NADP-dependent 3-hydroxy acid dehydrogenase YdfG
VAPLDVSDPSSVAAFAAGVERCDLLVNNAGGALGLEPIAEADEDHWRRMWEANVAGVMRMTKAFLPAIRRAAGHVVVVGSVAGFEVYPGGGGYTAAKHAASALVDTLRLELLGEPIRVTEIAPGLVETEFSLTRFDGDAERARRTYEGMQPLSADDVADCILFAATRPAHVNVDRLVVRPVAQATARDVARRAT